MTQRDLVFNGAMWSSTNIPLSIRIMRCLSKSELWYTVELTMREQNRTKNFGNLQEAYEFMQSVFDAHTSGFVTDEILNLRLA